jgi:excinuclease ABC subunit C
MYSQIGLDPEKKDIKRNIRNVKLFFSGKKKMLISKLEKEMMKKAKDLKFEEAGEIKRQIYALEHINDVALISDDTTNHDSFRIESYDVAHMSGKNSVGVMTVIENGKVKKSEYKKFILRDTKRGDDVGGLREIITRRLKHPEWEQADLIVIDGGKGQINEAKRIIKGIPVVSVLKDERHKPKDILGDKKIACKYKKEILLVNNEAHRFAINFFRSKQRKSFKTSS